MDISDERTIYSVDVRALFVYTCFNDYDRDTRCIPLSFDVNQVHLIALTVNYLNYVMDRPGKV